jgi:hypothetical protein
MGVPQRRRQARLWPVHAQRAGLLAPLVPAGALRPRQLEHAIGVVVADQTQHQAAAAGFLVDRQRVGAARFLAAVAAAVALGQAVQQVQGGGQLVVQAAQRAGHSRNSCTQKGRPCFGLSWMAPLMVDPTGLAGERGSSCSSARASAGSGRSIAKPRLSPLPLKPMPRRAEKARLSLRERSRISVEPRLPAASTTWRASSCKGAPRRACCAGSVCTSCRRQRRPRTLQAQQAGAADHAHPARTRLAQQVEVERVLGADVATAQAVAAVRAGLQHHAGGVRPGLLGNAERHQGRGPGVQALQGLHLGQGRSIHALHAQAPRHFDQACRRGSPGAASSAAPARNPRDRAAAARRR